MRDRSVSGAPFLNHYQQETMPDVWWWVSGPAAAISFVKEITSSQAT
ncbi:MAG: hypothetical protein AB7K37_11050 [Cyclobacteriaceae bacterium]